MNAPLRIDCAGATALAGDDAFVRRDAAARASFTTHLETCADCRRILGPELRLWEALARDPAPIAPPLAGPSTAGPSSFLGRLTAAAVFAAVCFGGWRLASFAPESSAHPRPLREAVVLVKEPAAHMPSFISTQSFVVIRHEGRRTAVRETSRLARLTSLDPP
jgi:hypothetical protein